MSLKVVSLLAENYKRLKAVEIKPGDAHLVTITGRNAVGKTSVLDAIWAALAGGEASRATAQPIRDGQDTAYVRVDLGEYIVTRRWTDDDAGSVTVEARDGARFSSPQKMLDELLGRRTFDPYAFLRLPAKDQVRTLLDLLGDSLGFDPDRLEAERRGIFDRRTEIGRDVKKLEGQLAGYPLPDGALPAEEVSSADVLAEEDAARAHNARIAAVIDDLANRKGDIDRATQRLAEVKRTLQLAEDDLDDARKALVSQLEVLDKMPDRIDVAAIRERLQSVEQTNQRIRQEQHRNAVAAELADRKSEVAQFTLALKDIDQRKADGLAAAAEKFPVAGLSFDDTGVTFNGITFAQASHAEQLRVSTALSMAFHPDLRVLRIDNGESLDAESLQIIEELAAANDYQIFMTKVADGPGAGIFIEDGSIVEGANR